jgi:antibiotic biosynthesis monooxygenase (ABM) superfamily enzyme
LAARRNPSHSSSRIRFKTGTEKQYEDWLAEIQRVVGGVAGYLGSEIFRPAHGSRKYTSILRFDSLDNLNIWAESETRQSLVAQVSHLLEQGDQVRINTGVDFWFTPEGSKPPKPWAGFDNYIDRAVVQCVNRMTPKWATRLAAYDVFIWDQCYAVEQS